MEELRLAFLVIGGCAIVGILAHGLWTVRKNAENDEPASLEPRDWEYDDEDAEDEESVIVLEQDAERKEPKLSNSEYDDLGLGAVRIVSETQAQSVQQTDSIEDTKLEEQQQQSESTEADLDLSEDVSALQAKQANETKSQPKIYSSVVTQPKPQYAAEQVQAMRSRASDRDKSSTDDIPEPPPFLLKTDEQTVENKTAKTQQEPEPLTLKSQSARPENSDSADAAVEKPSLAEQARNFVKRNKTEAKPKKRREPKIREDQMRIDFDEPQPAPAEAATQASPQDEPAPAQEVLVLNVKAPTDRPIQGAALLPMLLTLGFKFGDQDIFHRHVNSNGKGPVLFSLANMFKPGVFDIDNLENFTTQGVSLFMMLPIEGDPHQVFNMMHNAARKIADEFSAQVLDGRRSALTKQSLQQYVEKIREFERQRMIAK